MRDATLDSLRDWFDTWAGYVRARDFPAARTLFAADVVGFGTHMRIVYGIDALERDQWRAVWPSIEDFTFLTDELEGGVSGDGQMAWAIVPWSSTGFSEAGERFERPGRATVIFQRAAADSGWRGIHTHFSLAPGTPPRSWGDPGRR